jgi:hypothetical protein
MLSDEEGESDEVRDCEDDTVVVDDTNVEAESDEGISDVDINDVGMLG